MEHIEESVLGVDSSILPLQFDGGALVSDPACKAALLSKFFDGSSPEMLLAVQHPVITGPRFVLLPLGPMRSDGCYLNLILMVELICQDILLYFSEN